MCDYAPQSRGFAVWRSERQRPKGQRFNPLGLTSFPSGTLFQGMPPVNLRLLFLLLRYFPIYSYSLPYTPAALSGTDSAVCGLIQQVHNSQNQVLSHTRSRSIYRYDSGLRQLRALPQFVPFLKVLFGRCRAVLEKGSMGRWFLGISNRYLIPV